MPTSAPLPDGPGSNCASEFRYQRTHAGVWLGVKRERRNVLDARTHRRRTRFASLLPPLLFRLGSELRRHSDALRAEPRRDSARRRINDGDTSEVGEQPCVRQAGGAGRQHGLVRAALLLFLLLLLGAAASLLRLRLRLLLLGLSSARRLKPRCCGLLELRSDEPALERQGRRVAAALLAAELGEELPEVEHFAEAAELDYDGRLWAERDRAHARVGRAGIPDAQRALPHLRGANGGRRSRVVCFHLRIFLKRCLPSVKGLLQSLADMRISRSRGDTVHETL